MNALARFVTVLVFASFFAACGNIDAQSATSNGDECGCVDFGAYNVCFAAVPGASCAGSPSAICPAEFTSGHGACTCSASVTWECGTPDLGERD